MEVPVTEVVSYPVISLRMFTMPLRLCKTFMAIPSVAS